MAEVAIREAAPGDLPGILELMRHLNPADLPPDGATAGAIWQDILTRRFPLIFVADEGGRPVASCALAIIPNLTRGGRPYAVIENVVTHAERRRQGLGRRVLAAAVARAWEADCYKVALATGPRREATLRFYEDAGFTRGAKTYFEIRRA